MPWGTAGLLPRVAMPLPISLRDKLVLFVTSLHIFSLCLLILFFFFVSTNSSVLKINAIKDVLHKA